MPMESGEPELRRCAAALIRPLRHRILRAGLPPSAAEFPGDDDASTVHLAAVAADGVGTVIGCASLMLSAYAGDKAYQLRGMAIADGSRGLGIGGRLLARGEELVRAAGIARCWCNARSPAIPFYAKHGWTTDSDEFDISTAGPHRRMSKRL